MPPRLRCFPVHILPQQPLFPDTQSLVAIHEPPIGTVPACADDADDDDADLIDDDDDDDADLIDDDDDDDADLIDDDDDDDADCMDTAAFKLFMQHVI